MSWTQVYISGLPKSIDPSDEEIETFFDTRYNLTNDSAVLWAGYGTTLVKRDDSGRSRGFAFLTFYSAAGASTIVDRISTESTNDGVGDSEISQELLSLQLRAELSNPKAAKERNKKGGSKEGKGDMNHIRMKKHRGQPIRKHPVITSSSGKRTNQGNKTK